MYVRNFRYDAMFLLFLSLLPTSAGARTVHEKSFQKETLAKYPPNTYRSEDWLFLP